MSEILSAILPVFLIAGLAYVVSRRLPLDAKTLSSLNLYVFIPALVYSSLSKRALEWGLFARIAVASIVMLVAMAAVLTIVARLRRIAPERRSAFLLTQFPNLGNFGLPVCLFAFGEDGLAIAVVVLVCGSFLQNCVGIYYAQRTHYSAAKALGRVFQFPMIYAFVLALASQRTGWQLPLALERAVDITAGAAIPVQIIILGVQLARTRLETSVDLGLAAAIRLVGGPLLAAVLVILLRFDTLAAKVFITQMAGPVAVGMTAYAVQFNIAPRFLASIVAWTFLLSLVTVSAVLFLLSLAPL